MAVFDVSAGALEVLVGDVALQVGPDGARLQRVDGDAVSYPAPGRLHREKHVGGLRLCVSVPRFVTAVEEMDVVEDHRRAQVSSGADRDDAGPPGGRERAVQPG